MTAKTKAQAGAKQRANNKQAAKRSRADAHRSLGTLGGNVCPCSFGSDGGLSGNWRNDWSTPAVVQELPSFPSGAGLLSPGRDAGVGAWVNRRAHAALTLGHAHAARRTNLL